VQTESTPETRAGAKENPSAATRDAGLKDRFALALFCLAFAFNLFVVLRWAGQPLLDQHNFRQTQTAISCFWMARTSGPMNWVDYETPVLGSPWQIPLEFPLFQWLVTAVHLVTNLPLDPLGRCLSALLFYAILWPVAMLLRDYGCNRRCFHLAAGLLLLSPLYVYWSRAFLIESTALLFSFLFLAWFRRYLLTQRLGYIGLTTVAGTLALLVKVTTFLPFAAAAGLMFAVDATERKAWRRPRHALRVYLPLFIGATISAACLEAWLRHAAQVTASSYLASPLIPARLHGWLYGTLAQRLSIDFWGETLWKRAISETIGARLLLLVGLLALFRLGLRGCRLPAILVGLFLLPLLTFTNLHIVHNYYLYANGVFLVLAFALLLYRLSSESSFVLFALLCSAAVFAEVHSFVRTYLPSVREDFTGAPLLQTAQFIRDHTPQDSVLFVVGCDWNPAVPYYCQRRSVCMPGWATPNQIESVLQAPEGLCSSKPLAGVVEFANGFEQGRTGAWRSFVSALAQTNLTGRFGPYRAIILPTSDVWQNTILADSLPSTAQEEARWASHLPPGWRPAAASKDPPLFLQQAFLEGKPLPRSAVLSSTKPGAALGLFLRLSNVKSATSTSDVVLGLWGTRSWTTRYIRVSNQAGSPGSVSSGVSNIVEVLCRLPTDVPEDTYQASLVCWRQNRLVSSQLGLQLHILADWSETLPADWPEPLYTNLLGGIEALNVNGVAIGLTNSLVVAKAESTLHLHGWVANPAHIEADQQVLIALQATEHGLVRYVPAQRCWRPDVVQVYGERASEFCGFSVTARLPAELPAGDYHLWVVQKSGGDAGRMDVHRILRVRP
jgi:hypothetical protein